MQLFNATFQRNFSTQLFKVEQEKDGRSLGRKFTDCLGHPPVTSLDHGNSESFTHIINAIDEAKLRRGHVYLQDKASKIFSLMVDILSFCDRNPALFRFSDMFRNCL